MLRNSQDGAMRRRTTGTTMALGALDLDIIRCLQDDARSSFARIAGRLRVPESTVRHRLNRLVKDGVVEFATLTNPLHMGYQVWVLIDIQTELRRTRAVAERIAAAPEVYWVGITTGTHDLHVGAVFRSNEELLDFVTRRLSKIPGIVRASTSSILELIKRGYTIRLPAPPSSSRAERRRGAARRGRG